MAKSTNIKHLAVHELHWFPAKNVGRDASNNASDDAKKALVVSMASGWHEDQPLTGRELTPDEVTLALEEVAQLHNALKVATDDFPIVNPDGKKVMLTPADVLKAWEAGYVNKNGSYKKPSIGGVYAYQRSSTLPYVLAYRAKIALASGGKSADDFTIPTIIRQFDSQLEQDVACILENTSKEVGKTSVMLHWASLFKAVSAIRTGMISKGELVTEASIMRKLGWPSSLRGRVQKLYFLLLVDKFVNKRIIEDANTDFASIKVGTLCALHNDVVAKWRWEDISKVKVKVEDASIMASEILALFEETPTTQPKLPTRAQIMARISESTCKVEQLVLSLVLNNKLGRFEKMPIEAVKAFNSTFNTSSPLATDGSGADEEESEVDVVS